MLKNRGAWVILLCLLLSMWVGYASGQEHGNTIVVRFESGLVTDPNEPVRGECWELIEFSNAGHDSIFDQIGNAGVAELCAIGLAWRNNSGMAYDIHGDLVHIRDFSSVYKVRLAPNHNAQEAVVMLNAIEGVEYAEILGTCEPFGDRYIDEQWYIENTGDDSYNCSPYGVLECVEDVDMNISAAWAYADSSDALVGIIDTGVYTNGTGIPQNSELIAMYNSNLSVDFVDNDMDDACPHGTQVAGIVAANGDGAESQDMQGIVGFTSPSGWKPLVMLRVSGGCSILQEYVIDAIDYLSDSQSSAFGKVTIVNNSHGTPDPSETYADAYANAYAQDLAIFAGAGNADTGPSYPYPAAFIDFSSSVAHVRCDETRLSYSSGNYIDVTAPGGSHIATTGNTAEDYCFGGTSAATPMASGVASLLREFESNLTNDDVYALLALTATDIGTSGYDVSYGHGLIRADEALAALDEAVTGFGPRVRSATITSSSSIASVDSLRMYVSNIPGVEPQGRAPYVKVYKVAGAKTITPGMGNFIAYAWTRAKSCETVRGPEDLWYLDHEGDDQGIYPYLNGNRLGNWASVESVVNNVVSVYGYVYHMYEDDTEQDDLGWFPFNPWNSPPSPLFTIAYILHASKGKSQAAEVEPNLREIQMNGSKLEFSLLSPSNVHLSLYDVSGRLVRDLGEERLSAGTHSIEMVFRVRRLGLPAGVYFVRAEAEGVARTTKMIYLK